MSCWSREQFHFTIEDERLLEMMASSVATAIVASETVETNARHAYIDPLTDLPNRRQLNEDLHGFLARLHEKSASAVVAMADIDHFKRFNDDYGHKAGDITLQTVASVWLKPSVTLTTSTATAAKNSSSSSSTSMAREPRRLPKDSALPWKAPSSKYQASLRLGQ
jgi:hypothetical protein